MIILWSENATKIGLSLVLGSVVGIEREYNEKPAGLKTNVLICLGSTLFTLISSHALINETSRDFHIAAQIVTGIGFLGAGAIMREGDRVIGLTTAAVIWVVAAIGMSIGMGYYTIAGIATVGTLIVQMGFGQVDLLIDKLRQRHVFRIVSNPDERAVKTIESIFKAHKMRVLYSKITKKDKFYHSEWVAAGFGEQEEAAAHDLLRSDHVIEVIY